MADSGSAGPELSGCAAAGTTFHLEVNTLAGGCLATIPDAQGSWQLGDVLSKLPRVLPGHRYQLLKGEAVLAPGTAIAGWAQPVDGRACVTALVVVAPRTREKQQELDKALIDAAGAWDIEKVRELLISGADATFQPGHPTNITALHAAVTARGPRRLGSSKDKEEEEGRLEAVLGALLSAQADVNHALPFTFRCALHSAVQRGSLGAVRVLLDARASIDAAANDYSVHSFTALHAATQAGNLTLAALLLERGADVNAIKQYKEMMQRTAGFIQVVHIQETALHMAVEGGHQALVALLVQARADTSIGRSCSGEDTPLEQLCAGRPGMLDLLRPDTSAALLAGGAFGAEVEAALAAIAARRAPA